MLSSRRGAPLQRDGLGRVVVREERVHSCGETAQRLDYDSFGRVLRDTNPGWDGAGRFVFPGSNSLVRYGRANIESGRMGYDGDCHFKKLDYGRRASNELG